MERSSPKISRRFVSFMITVNTDSLLKFLSSEGRLCALQCCVRKRPWFASDFYIETEALHFFDQDVEGLWGTRLQRIIAFDDRLINSCSALHIVGFHREQLLESVGSAVRFECPNLHLTETLATVLRFAAQRLLRH